MTCTVCHCELTGDVEYDFRVCVGCQADENEDTQVMEAVGEAND